MKRLLYIVLIVLVFSGRNNIQAQTPENWPDASHGVSIFASTLLGAFTPVILSYDYLSHGNRGHVGFTTGLTTTFCEGAKYEQLGGHFALTLMTGMSNNHFETKLGIVYNPFILYNKSDYADWAFKYIPVVSLGYRYQKPGGRMFYRIALSTGGIGAGTGFLFYSDKGSTDSPE